MKTETIEYQAGNQRLKGHLAYKDKTPRPAVIVAHAWMGQDDFARQQAEKLAEQGYIGFAADVYGDGKTVKTKEEATALMKPLFYDRTLLQERIVAAFNVVKELPFADKQKIGAIGFCFGGLTVIELLRSGVDIRGVVSFHGLLANKLSGKEAKRAPERPIKGSLLVLNGANDPMVSLDDIVNLQKEMDRLNVDWEFNNYSKTMHAFTNPEVNDPQSGLVYQPKTAARAFLAMKTFFQEIFS